MKLKYINLFTIIMFVLILGACQKKEEVSFEYEVRKPIPDEVMAAKRVFKEYTEIFYELQEYYSSLDYEIILKDVEDSQIIEVDGVEYSASLYEEDYIISCFDGDDQNGKENLPASVFEIRSRIKNYMGFVLRVDKETYELVDIEINISKDLEGIALCIIWGKTEKDTVECNIFFDDHWGMAVLTLS